MVPLRAALTLERKTVFTTVSRPTLARLSCLYCAEYVFMPEVMMSQTLNNNEQEDSNSDSSTAAFFKVDFSGVNFDAMDEHTDPFLDLLPYEQRMLSWERQVVYGDFSFLNNNDENVEGNDSLKQVRDLVRLLSLGDYAAIMRSSGFAVRVLLREGYDNDIPPGSVMNWIRTRVLQTCTSLVDCIEAELVGIAALNVFLQCNYTGPSLYEHDQDSTRHSIDKRRSLVDDINPHKCFSHLLANGQRQRQTYESKEIKPTNRFEDDKETETVSPKLTKLSRNTHQQNAILSELVVDGEWPVQVCDFPYFLLLARAILGTLADPDNSNGWISGTSIDGDKGLSDLYRIPDGTAVAKSSPLLFGARLWCARAAVAHERLLQSRSPSDTLWSEVRELFQGCLESNGCLPEHNDDTDISTHHSVSRERATVMLEYGLAHHHFDRPGNGKELFRQAQELSGLTIEVTGAIGKRTKYQQNPTAQMLVKAQSATRTSQQEQRTTLERRNDHEATRMELIQKQMVEHSDEEILLERVKFDESANNSVSDLCILDQAILLALCLDVKNSNPADALTAEQMGAYLARVLEHHDDWMVYSTALLERAWLEFERTHARERAILQMQALVDQHSNRLTITQSTRQSVEESAPVQDRIRHLHTIVYPPRWLMIQDLADRYAGLGIVTSAAELYTEIEFWDDVVDCYRRAGRVSHAEQIVRERLAMYETPRMWLALGDLTHDPAHYERSAEVSNGRFWNAYGALGSYYFDRGDLEKSASYYETALKIRPLNPTAWFRLGTIQMRLGRWDLALNAFTEVVQQEPEEAEAWANVAAIHMRNNQPAEAYPALVESLKHNRNSWRVWVSKLYACLDLKKYDEAVQACNVLLDLRSSRPPSDSVPLVEEKCVRGIVGGALNYYRASHGDGAALDSARRTLSRVHALLDRIGNSGNAEPWVFEAMAYLNEQVGHYEQVVEDLMKEYRTLQLIPDWENDSNLVRKVCRLVSQIVALYQLSNRPEDLTKARFLIRGVLGRLRSSRSGPTTSESDEVSRLEKIWNEMERQPSNLK